MDSRHSTVAAQVDGGKGFAMDGLTTTWWLVLIRGIAAIMFGCAAFFAPAATLAVLWVLLAVFLVVDGIVLVVSGLVRMQHDAHWWVTLLQGLVVLGVGALFVWKAQSSASVVFWILGALLLMAGIAQVVQGWRLRAQVEGEWLLMLGGVLWAIFGILFMFEPLVAAQSFVWIVGIWAVVSGVLSIVLAFRIRSAASRFRLPGGGGPTASA